MIPFWNLRASHFSSVNWNMKSGGNRFMFLLTALFRFPLSLDRVRPGLVFVDHHLLASNLVNLALNHLQLFHTSFL